MSWHFLKNRLSLYCPVADHTTAKEKTIVEMKEKNMIRVNNYLDRKRQALCVTEDDWKESKGDPQQKQ